MKKVLDKAGQYCYNIRIGVEAGKDKAMKLDNLSSLYRHSCDKDMSLKVDNYIACLGAEIKKVHQSFSYDVPCPVIAGGCIRDAVHGLMPKDYDIFLDITAVPEDDKDDVVNLFGTHLIDFMGWRGWGVFHKVGDEYTKKGQGDHIDQFVVYETTNENFLPETKPVLQFIGRDDISFSSDPTLLMDDFDYSLVRGWYDPMDTSYHLHPSFVKSLNDKIVDVSRGKETYDRAVPWSWRLPDSPYQFTGYEPKTGDTVTTSSRVRRPSRAGTIFDTNFFGNQMVWKVINN